MAKFALHHSMIIMKYSIFLLIFSFALACKPAAENTAAGTEKTEVNQDTAGTEKTELKQNTSGPEYTSAYICPMHCKGSGSDKEGVCPVCGMDYVANDQQNHEGHDHEGHDHEGHDH